MKPLCAIVLILSVALCAAATPGSTPRLWEVSTKITAAGQKKDVQAAVAFLEAAQTIPSWGWGFQDGVGPIDPAYIVGNALLSFEPFLPWRRKVAAALENAPNSPLFAWLRNTVQDREAILAMLLSEDPFPRWIALEKIKHSGELSEELAARLRIMAADDSRLMILRRRHVDARFDYFERVFDAPLRRIAIEILLQAGERPPEIDQRMLSIEGLAWLAKIYLSKLDDREERFGIRGALLTLAPITPEIVDAKRGMDITIVPEAWLARFQSLAEGGTRTSANSSMSTSKPQSSVQIYESGDGSSSLRNGKQQANTRPAGGIVWWWVAAVTLFILGIIVFFRFVSRNK